MYHIFGQKEAKAKNLLGMLKKDANGEPIGKICVVYNAADRALSASASWMQSFEDRLGRVVHEYEPQYVHEKFRKYIESFNYIKFLQADDAKFYLMGIKIPEPWHSYQFEWNALQYYKSKLITSQRKPTEVGGFYTIRNKVNKLYVKATEDNYIKEEVITSKDGNEDECCFNFKLKNKMDGNGRVCVHNYQKSIHLFFRDEYKVQMRADSYDMKLKENDDGTFTIFGADK